MNEAAGNRHGLQAQTKPQIFMWASPSPAPWAQAIWLGAMCYVYAGVHSVTAHWALKETCTQLRALKANQAHPSPSAAWCCAQAHPRQSPPGCGHRDRHAARDAGPGSVSPACRVLRWTPSESPDGSWRTTLSRTHSLLLWARAAQFPWLPVVSLHAGLEQQRNEVKSDKSKYEKSEICSLCQTFNLNCGIFLSS